MDYSNLSKEIPDRKRKTDFLLENLNKNMEDFNCPKSNAIIENERVRNIYTKCFDMSRKSLDTLSETKRNGEIDSIEDCARGRSEIRSWIETSIKNRILKSEIEDINSYFNRLEEMADKTEFIDSIESESRVANKTFIAIMKKKRDELSNREL